MMMVCYHNQPQPPFDREARAFDPMREVIWSVVGDGQCANHVETLGYTDEIIRLSKIHKNITGGVFDDFFQEGRDEVYTPQVMAQIQQKFHEAGLNLWVVVYDHQLDKPLEKHLAYIDGITYWTARGRDLDKFDENFARLKAKAPDKRILLGFYIFNYGEWKEMTREQVAWQMERYTQLIRSGEAEGMILLSNCVADLGFEGVEYVREYLLQHGDEEI